MKTPTVEMLKKGYIVIPNSLLEYYSATHGPTEGRFEALIRVLMNVNYSDTKCDSCGQHFICHRGESPHSLLHWASLLGWKRTQTRHFFNAMIKEGIIERLPSPNGMMRIRVNNYDLWTGKLKAYETGNSSSDRSFHLFWEKYHEMTQTAKVNIGRARREWKKLSEPERQAAIESVEEYYCHLNDTRFCKQAAMYLADKAFLNEYEM